MSASRNIRKELRKRKVRVLHERRSKRERGVCEGEWHGLRYR